MSHQKEEDMLNEYPDLSDEEEIVPANTLKEVEEKILPNSQPHKLTKPNQSLNPPPQRQVFTAPLLFGGRPFIPPPPPPGSKGKMNFAPPPPVNHSYQKVPTPNPQNNFRSNQQPPRPQRQRKNCVYVKNIPKHYNEVQKLMTFFKNQGQIREIKVNHEDFSATVRFAKEEDSIKFINSNKAIFNRSFITYSLNEKDVVPIQLIKQRENDESGKIKKPIEVEMKLSRDRLETILADKIRALLFLIKNISQEKALEQLKEQLSKSIQQKGLLQKYNYEELETANKMITNEYDWTIAYTYPRNVETEKKAIFNQLQKKFGPISTLEFTPISSSLETRPSNGTSDIPQQVATEYIVKLHFLGIKNSWEYYYAKHLNQGGSNNEQKGIQIQGSRLKVLFNQGIIKQPIHKQQSVSSNREDQKEQPIQEGNQELVEIGQNGQIRLVQQQQCVIEAQVNQFQVGKPKNEEEQGK